MILICKISHIDLTVTVLHAMTLMKAVCVCVCARMHTCALSHVQLFETPWTVAHQVLLLKIFCLK